MRVSEAYGILSTELNGAFDLSKSVSIPKNSIRTAFLGFSIMLDCVTIVAKPMFHFFASLENMDGVNFFLCDISMGVSDFLSHDLPQDGNELSGLISARSLCRQRHIIIHSN